jgi:hypothetical protein
MISIVDPKALEHVLRPTVYATAVVGAMPPAFASEPGEKTRVKGRSPDDQSTNRDGEPTSS